jgi:hypothetical protein
VSPIETEPQLWTSVILWGPGILILVGLFALIRWTVPKDFFGHFLESQRGIAKGLQDLATTVRDQGGSQERRLAELAHGQDVMLDRLNVIKGHLEERPHAGT